MTNDTGAPQATNVVVADSINLHVTTKKVETATNVYPGRVLMHGTNDDDVVVCDGTAIAEGFAGYEHTAKKYRPVTISTIYTQNDKIAVVKGPGTKIRATLAVGSVAVVGTLLTAAADGCLTPGTAGTDDIIAQAAEAVTTTAAVAPIMIWSRI
ncbi:MAG: hypothetical protein WC325_12125 [Candidatus Bathyarchaeia archaeon]